MRIQVCVVVNRRIFEARRIINPDNNYYTYSRAFAEVEEFEFVEKKRKPHHIRKKKGWEI